VTWRKGQYYVLVLEKNVCDLAATNSESQVENPRAGENVTLMDTQMFFSVGTLNRTQSVKA
jgi:hypothetical protein